MLAKIVGLSLSIDSVLVSNFTFELFPCIPNPASAIHQGDGWDARTTLDPRTPGGRQRLSQLGEICAFDAFIHNVDRVRGGVRLLEQGGRGLVV